MEPQVQADLAPAVAPRRPERGRPLLGAHPQARPDDQHHQEHVEEVLPPEPRREPDRRPLGQVVLARVRREEVGAPLRAEQPAHREHGHRGGVQEARAADDHGARPLSAGEGADPLRLRPRGVAARACRRTRPHGPRERQRLRQRHPVAVAGRDRRAAARSGRPLRRPGAAQPRRLGMRRRPAASSRSTRARPRHPSRAGPRRGSEAGGRPGLAARHARQAPAQRPRARAPAPRRGHVLRDRRQPEPPSAAT